jgi:hypothetical protein
LLKGSLKPYDAASFSVVLLKDLEPYLPERGDNDSNPYARYRTDPIGYVEKELHVTPWSGRSKKGQRELFADIGESVRKQLAGEPAIRIFRVEAGHGVGKTFGAAGLVNWFFDAFAPSITMTTAPTKPQVVKLLAPRRHAGARFAV